jgi:hypothetical protein
MTTAEALSLVERAGDARVVFKNPVEAKKRFRELAQLIHPDKVAPEHRARATAAFAKLEGFRDAVNGKPLAPTLGEWTVDSALVRGGVADLYLASARDVTAVIKLARLPKDNALLASEAEALEIEREARRHDRRTLEAAGQQSLPQNK